VDHIEPDSPRGIAARAFLLRGAVGSLYGLDRPAPPLRQLLDLCGVGSRVTAAWLWLRDFELRDAKQSLD
jgi:hypothetical protein